MLMLISFKDSNSQHIQSQMK